MIGEPTNFVHTAHVGSGDLFSGMNSVSTRAEQVGGSVSTRAEQVGGALGRGQMHLPGECAVPTELQTFRTHS